MRRISFIITILGMLILISLLLFSSPIEISSSDQLPPLLPNQKVQITGLVTSEKISQTHKTLTINNITLICPRPCPSFLNQNIQALGLIEKYNDKIQIKILKIK